jgi:quercetin dioxygenase-like cupin family protein
MPTLKITRWETAHAPTEAELRARMRGEKLAPYAWRNAPGDEYAPHLHSYNKVIYVVAGSLLWFLPQTGERVETRAGDRLELPAGVMHGAQVGAQGVVCLEAHC